MHCNEISPVAPKRCVVRADPVRLRLFSMRSTMPNICTSPIHMSVSGHKSRRSCTVFLISKWCCFFLLASAAYSLNLYLPGRQETTLSAEADEVLGVSYHQKARGSSREQLLSERVLWPSPDFAREPLTTLRHLPRAHWFAGNVDSISRV